VAGPCRPRFPILCSYPLLGLSGQREAAAQGCAGGGDAASPRRCPRASIAAVHRATMIQRVVSEEEAELQC
jgi:hypothetical protein